MIAGGARPCEIQWRNACGVCAHKEKTFVRASEYAEAGNLIVYLCVVCYKYEKSGYNETIGSMPGVNPEVGPLVFVQPALAFGEKQRHLTNIKKTHDFLRKRRF